MPNKCMFVGRICNKPIGKETSRGEPMCWFKIACKTGFGSAVETDYIDIIAFGDKAKTILKYGELHMRVYIEGVLKTYKKDISESKRYEARYNIRVTEFYMLSTRSEMKAYRNADALNAQMLRGGKSAATFPPYKPKKPPKEKPPEEDIFDDEISEEEIEEMKSDFGDIPPIPF